MKRYRRGYRGHSAMYGGHGEGLLSGGGHNFGGGYLTGGLHNTAQQTGGWLSNKINSGLASGDQHRLSRWISSGFGKRNAISYKGVRGRYNGNFQTDKSSLSYPDQYRENNTSY